MLAKVGNKALWDSFDVLDPKILLIKLDFIFYCLILYKTRWWLNDQFFQKGRQY